jgi:hypothetical protein
LHGLVRLLESHSIVSAFAEAKLSPNTTLSVVQMMSLTFIVDSPYAG